MTSSAHGRGPEGSNAPVGGERASGSGPRRVLQEPGGPTLVEGPVEVVMDDGRAVRSDRPVVAVCTCHRSSILPWCDTSHRGHRPRRSGPGGPARKPRRAPGPGGAGEEPG